MPKEYKCDICNYSTNDASNYKKHCSRRKHKYKLLELGIVPSENPPIPDNISEKEEEAIIKVKKKKGKTFVCRYCGFSYGRLDNLKRHQKKCTDALIQEKEEELKLKTNELQKRDKELEQRDEELKNRDEEIHFYRQLLKINGESEGNVSKFKFVRKSYKDVDALQKITYREFKKNGEILYIKNNKSYRTRLAQEIIYCFDNDIMTQHIGDIIISTYNNKVSPEQRQFWVSDCSRLKFIVRTIRENGIQCWEADEGGNIIIQKIIQPILLKIKEILGLYMEKYCNPQRCEVYDYDAQQKIMAQQQTIMKIIKMIDHGKFNKKILRYIAPKFEVETGGSGTSNEESIIQKPDIKRLDFE